MSALQDENLQSLKLVRASAGTGKTYALTGHYLALLKAGHDPETILATTFTRKAAGEIFGRVLTRLAEEADTDPGSRKRLVDLCGRLHRVSISTLDSFFQRMGGGFKLELDLPPEPTVVDERSPMALELRQQAVADLVREGVADDSAFSTLLDLLGRLNNGRDKRSLRDAIDGIVSSHADVYREARDAGVWDRVVVPGHPSDAKIAQAVKVIAGMEEELPRGKSGKKAINAHWQKSWTATQKLVPMGDWDAVLSLGLVGKMVLSEEKFSQKEITAEWQIAYAPILAKLKSVLLERISLQTKATFELMKQFDARYDALRRERGVLLYSDVPERLRGLIETRGSAEEQAAAQDLMREIQYRLDAQVTHLLLDEFQDTSTGQWRVLQEFAQEITSEENRSLFVVGDTKQAIYGWRGGRAELFDAVFEMMADATPEAAVGSAENGTKMPFEQSLDHSYRSSPVIMKAVSEFFSVVDKQPAWDTDPADRAAALRFREMFETHQASEKTQDLRGYFSIESSKKDEKGGDSNRSEDDNGEDDTGGGAVAEDGTDDDCEITRDHLDFVADRVQEIHQAAPHAEIGVIMSTNKGVHRVLLALRALDLPASGEGGYSLAGQPAVSYLLAALCLADNPGDSAARVQVTRGPLGTMFGLGTDVPGEDLAKNAAIFAQLTRARLVDEGFAGVVADWSQQLRTHVKAAEAEVLGRFATLARDYDTQYPARHTLRPRMFVEYVEATRVEQVTSAPIRVMTVHKSKGLEFDAVVLPELDKTLSIKGDVLTEREHPLGPVTGVWRWPGEAVRAFDQRIAAAYAAERTRRQTENLCALYVAMTRAKRALYLFVEPPPSKWPKEPKARHALALRECFGVGGGESHAEGDPGWHLGLTPRPAPTTPAARKQLNFPRDAEPTRMRPTVSPSSAEVRGGTVRGAALLSRQPSWGQRYGTRVHEALCEIEYLDNFDEDGASEELVKAFGHDVVREAFTRRFEREDAPWRERRFVVPRGGRWLRGSFDRVVVGRNAAGDYEAAHLIDFKTDSLKAGDTTALEQKIDNYQGQMDAYREALSILLTLPASAITAELLFVGPGIRADV